MEEHFQQDLQDAIAYQTTIMAGPPSSVKQRLDVLRKVLHRPDVAKQTGAFMIVSNAGKQELEPLTIGISIGSSEEASLVLDAPYVSRRHCELQTVGEDWLLKDCASTNGLYVNGEKVAERLLRDGDIIQVGAATLLFFRGRDEFLPETES